MKPAEIWQKVRDLYDEAVEYTLPPGMRRNIAFGLVGITMLGGFLLSETSPLPATIETKTKHEINATPVEMKSGGKHVFELEVVKTPVDLEIGLMFVKHMEPDHGMLFEMGRDPKEVSFWMKNTFIPLDIVFVDQNGIIVNIHRNAVPQSLDAIPSIQPVTGVIELNGGRADAVGLNIGDKVIHPYFHTYKKAE